MKNPAYDPDGTGSKTSCWISLSTWGLFSSGLLLYKYVIKWFSLLKMNFMMLFNLHWIDDFKLPLNPHSQIN